MNDCKYPDITVELTGEDGNAFAIIGRATNRMRRAKCTQEQISEFQAEATQGNYDHVIQTCMEYFNVE